MEKDRLRNRFLKNPSVFTSVIFRRLFMKIRVKIEVMEKSVGNFGHFKKTGTYRRSVSP